MTSQLADYKFREYAPNGFALPASLVILKNSQRDGTGIEIVVPCAVESLLSKLPLAFSASLPNLERSSTNSPRSLTSPRIFTLHQAGDSYLWSLSRAFLLSNVSFESSNLKLYIKSYPISRPTAAITLEISLDA